MTSFFPPFASSIVCATFEKLVTFSSPVRRINGKAILMNVKRHSQKESKSGNWCAIEIAQSRINFTFPLLLHLLVSLLGWVRLATCRRRLRAPSVCSSCRSARWNSVINENRAQHYGAQTSEPSDGAGLGSSSSSGNGPCCADGFTWFEKGKNARRTERRKKFLVHCAAAYVMVERFT